MEHVCGWIGHVHGCYIMHCQSVNSSFQLFSKSDFLLPVASDDEQKGNLVAPSDGNNIHGYSMEEGNIPS